MEEAFALVREVGQRIMGMRLYDVQLIGAQVLHSGKIAEMKTGEGKTFAAVPAVYLNALAGRGVHVVTVNDYLARRDAEWMREVYTALGVSVGVIESMMDPATRREAYACDVTYGTNSEFGFDYLRDNMAVRLEDTVQRGHFFCIVDGRLDPHRRGPHAAHHLRHPGGGGRHVLPLRPRHPDTQEGRGLRGRRESTAPRPPTESVWTRWSGPSASRTSTSTSTGSW